MGDCIFGINRNGISLEVAQLSIDKDQSSYDYICNVSLQNDNNGNGRYDISIINKDYIKGLPIGKWKIVDAWIIYDWGNASAYLIMEDEEGHKTREIPAGIQRNRDCYIPTLARTVFSKAQNIIINYPNAKIYNAIMALNESKENLNPSYIIDKYKSALSKSDEYFINFIENAASLFSHHLKIYKETATLLKDSNDPRSINLLKEISEECKKTIELLIDSNNKY